MNAQELVDALLRDLDDRAGLSLSDIDSGDLQRWREDWCAIVEGATGWQPIETAPKDGTHVLLYIGSTEAKIFSGRWDTHPDCKCWIAGGYMRKQTRPTHWMPLPPPPEGEQ